VNLVIVEEQKNRERKYWRNQSGNSACRIQGVISSHQFSPEMAKSQEALRNSVLTWQGGEKLSSNRRSAPKAHEPLAQNRPDAKTPRGSLKSERINRLKCPWRIWRLSGSFFNILPGQYLGKSQGPTVVLSAPKNGLNLALQSSIWF